MAAAPCSVWNFDTSCDQTYWNALSPAAKTRALTLATYIAWARTGRQFDPCTVTVRPCGNDCNDNGLGGWYWGGGMFLPYIVDGMWRNCWCGTGPNCNSCRPSCQVYLPGPVQSVTSVTVDGAVVDPSTYRVDDGRWLVRTGTGNCWPDCQNYDVSSGTGTFFVTYLRGDQIPDALLAAGGALAIEFAKACAGEDCRLAPAFVTSISRQGVEFTMANPIQLVEMGLTGLWDFDQIVAAINPAGLTHRMRLMTPDDPGPRMTTWP